MNPTPRTEFPGSMYGQEIARLPLTMQPGLYQQLNGWDNLYPFEQRRLTEFLHNVSLVSAKELNHLTSRLRVFEYQMGVPRWKFSCQTDTMANASQLARSPYYLEWRQEVQRVFVAIQAKTAEAGDSEPPASRLLFLVFPKSLPLQSIAGKSPWDVRGMEFTVEGDPSHISEMVLSGSSGLVAMLSSLFAGNDDLSRANSWLVDADAGLGNLLGGHRNMTSLLEYGELRRFRDEFLVQANRVPKDIEGADEILAGLRKQNWDAWWPASINGENRLRSFVIEIFLSGNGALIFSNAFVQWACSEAIRRARPRLVVGRFGLRTRPKPFTSIAIFENQQKISAMQDSDDPEGSAIDALILARYVWLSMMRYPERDQATCVCLSESSGRGYLIAPKDKSPDWASGRGIPPTQLVQWMRQVLL